MGDELATANVNRTYSLSATSIAIFTFTMLFLYPMFARGEIDRDEYLRTLDVLKGDATSTHRSAKNEPGSTSSRAPATGLLTASEPVSAHWNVVGLTCPADATRLERELGHIPGVISVVVNPLTEQADIRFNASVVSELELRDGVKRSGYGLE